MDQRTAPWSPAAATAVVVIAIAAVLALLYLARAVLVPVTLALVLSFATAPFVRVLHRLGLSHVTSVLSVVLSMAVVVVWLAALIGSRAVQLAEAFPAYRETFVSNMQAVRGVALSPIEKTWEAAERMLDPPAATSPQPQAVTGLWPSDVTASTPIAIELHPVRATPFEHLRRLLSWAWAPLGSAAIVIVVMTFALLERESLRDRFIRLVGGSDLRATTNAINDAGDRLSRYLARLFAVNIGVGLTVWLALTWIGLPDAALVATLAAVFRFVPFLGMPIVGLMATLLALGAAPGWALALSTLATFSAIELIVANAVEPRVYGRATGLSSFVIVLAAIFWGALWGPIGVLIATPITLCLSVAGRHFEYLNMFNIVLGEDPALTMTQKFYQRALSGDPDEIIEGAHGFLKRRSFSEYCDVVMVPALQLGRIDWESNQISSRQYAALRFAIAHVMAHFGGTESDLFSTDRRLTALERILSGSLIWCRNAFTQRRLANHRIGGNLPSANTGSIVLCLGMGLPADELAAELLVRILRAARIDARHIKDAGDLESLHVYGIAINNIDAVCMATMTAPEAPEHGVELARSVRTLLPHARTLGLLLPGRVEHPDTLPVSRFVDCVALSFANAARELDPARRNSGPSSGVRRQPT